MKKTAAVELLQRNVRRFLSQKKQYLREHSALVIQRHYNAFRQARVARYFLSLIFLNQYFYDFHFSD